MKRVVKDFSGTAEVAKAFLEKILKENKKRKGALVVGLSGELGAGKTAFTQAVARHLGVKNKVISPTFVIAKKYPIKKSDKKLQRHKFLFHLDAYRLKNENELLMLGWQEIIDDENHLVFIEWPENVKNVIPADTKFIHITVDEKGARNFTLK